MNGNCGSQTTAPLQLSVHHSIPGKCFWPSPVFCVWSLAWATVGVSSCTAVTGSTGVNGTGCGGTRGKGGVSEVLTSFDGCIADGLVSLCSTPNLFKSLVRSIPQKSTKTAKYDFAAGLRT